MSAEDANDKTAYLVIVAVTLLSILFMCGFATALLQVFPPDLAINNRFLTYLCVRANIGNGVSMAAWVSSPISGRTGNIRKPALQSHIVCGFAPWVPALPVNEKWEIER
jgi:hypothetical protein